MTASEKTELALKAVRLLSDRAQIVPCDCTPRRGGTTHARHYSLCSWDQWLDGFWAGLSLVGIGDQDVPSVVIGGREVRVDDNG